MVVPHDVFLLNNQHYFPTGLRERFGAGFSALSRLVLGGSKVPVEGLVRFCNRGSGAGCVVVPEILLGWFTRFGEISGVGSGIRYTSTGLKLDRFTGRSSAWFS